MISIRIGRSSPSPIATSSIAAAESEWIADAAALERDPRAALLHVERVGDAQDARLERQRLAVGAVADDPLQHLGDHHGQLGLVVDPVEQLAQLRLGEEEAEVLVAVPVHRHADAVGERGQRDDHLGVVARHPVVGHHRRLDRRAS